MLNKRGIGNEIDWIIGTGLFLLSVVFIFVIFRPGITKVYDSKTLLDIIQDGFNNDTEWSITTAPLFLYPSNETNTANPAVVTLASKEINISCDSSSCQTSDFEGITKIITGKDKINIRVYYIKRDRNDRLSGNFNIDKNKDKSEIACSTEEEKCKDIDPKLLDETRELYQLPDFDREGDILYNLTDSLISIPARLDSPIDTTAKQPLKTKYLISSSNRPINFDISNITIQNVKRYLACSKKDSSDWPYMGSVASKCPVIYELGVTETLSGIDLVSFLTLNQTELETGCSKGYDCIKEKWKFPLSRDFTIRIESLPIGGSQINISALFPGKISPPPNANVFIRQFNSFILTEESTRVPVVVRIATW